MSNLTELPNIGKTLVQQLEDIGIHTAQELVDLGSRDAWRRIQANDPSACYHRLCALEGAIRGIRWHDLPTDLKADLKDFYQSHKL